MEKILHDAVNLTAVVNCTNQTAAPFSQKKTNKQKNQNHEMELPDFTEKEEMQMIIASQCIDPILK